MPKGASVVAFHSTAGSGAPASTYAMRKRPNGVWDYSIADTEDRMVAQGSLPLCGRCHADAPSDSLFVPAAR